jgi:hypothetical protein
MEMGINKIVGTYSEFFAAESNAVLNSQILGR